MIDEIWAKFPTVHRMFSVQVTWKSLVTSPKLYAYISLAASRILQIRAHIYMVQILRQQLSRKFLFHNWIS